ncbi:MULTISPECIES: GNAT family N-acetyltransferase [Pseudomonas]|uniref:Acetyltransferase, GNAT family n=1 Tax=Pseudomonas lactis TaxID=1615674 RepID=I4K899_9PSED|nr:MULTISPECIES: GNAT family N-acetyltransferase [Pseudomonas]EIK60939.1 acetyltransferase, GNAT family [Pseudomonas lactis]MDI3249992.1 GNAT family N-acetyltransferase [Pseudomonas sp. AL10]MDI3265924.1 GNAT family N-acetyltransferase [Pseudomonas sp. AL15]NNA45451.1 GNAT family N-acetyltransferase [Pseudomonas lactis]
MIRRALPADAKAIAQVHISSWQDAYRDLMPAQFLSGLQATLARREAYWARSIASGESTVWVAEVGQQIVGWISVGASRDEDAVQAKAGEVMAIYVLAGHWQTGVGLALWKAGLQDLLAQGYERLTLWVLAGNERAIRFYRRAGCVEEAGTERDLERGGVALVEVRYGLPLR